MSRQSIRASVGEGGVRLTPEAFKQKLMQMTDDVLKDLYAIWGETGYDDSECQGLLGEVLGKFKERYREELVAERHILDHAKTQVQQKLQTYNELCQKLGRAGKDEASVGGSCTTRLVALDKLIFEADQEISQREKVFQTELQRCATVAAALGEPAKVLDDFKGPPGTTPFSDARLVLIKEYYNSLETAKNRRQIEVVEIANNCCQQMVDLEVYSEGWQPCSESPVTVDMASCVAMLSKYSENGNREVLGLRTADLQMLKNCLVVLVQEKEARRNELAKLGAEIARLWTLLRVPSADRELFQTSFKMNLSMETILKGRGELDRLLALRQTSMKQIVSSIRAEILALWEESGMDSPELQAEEFPIYFKDVESLDDNVVSIIFMKLLYFHHVNYFLIDFVFVFTCFIFILG